MRNGRGVADGNAASGWWENNHGVSEGRPRATAATGACGVAVRNVDLVAGGAIPQLPLLEPLAHLCGGGSNWLGRGRRDGLGRGRHVAKPLLVHNARTGVHPLLQPKVTTLTRGHRLLAALTDDRSRRCNRGSRRLLDRLHHDHHSLRRRRNDTSQLAQQPAVTMIAQHLTELHRPAAMRTESGLARVNEDPRLRIADLVTGLRTSGDLALACPAVSTTSTTVMGGGTSTPSSRSLTTPFGLLFFLFLFFSITHSTSLLCHEWRLV